MLVTNTRDTGTIKVTKKLVPATDGGKFNLLIDGQAKATNVGDGGTTGTQTVTTGAHTVGESAGTGTSLANYDATTSCVDKAHGGPADTDGNVQVDKGDQWECVITNTRKIGTIKVTKELAPATDSGKFNLLIDGQAKATDVGDGGTTGVQTVLPGTHTVGEAAGTATDLANYDSTLSCRDTAHPSDPGRHRRQRPGRRGRRLGVRDHQHAQELAPAAEEPPTDRRRPAAGRPGRQPAGRGQPRTRAARAARSSAVPAAARPPARWRPASRAAGSSR